MTNTIETLEYKGHDIEICYDESPLNPRTEWDNLTEIHCCSRNYYLGENNHSDWEEVRQVVREALRNNDMVLKLYAYIHSGTALSLESFHGKLSQGHAEFDSGQCGFIIIRRKVILENFGGKILTKKLKQKAYEVAEGEIETLTNYLNGYVYGYIVDDGEGDSCWGYDGDTEYAIEAGKEAVDYMVKNAIKEHCQQVKTWILNKVPLINRTTLIV